jgi:hypothetical protein
LLHSPPLSKSSHLIPEISNALTNEVPSAIRDSESKSRDQLDSLVSVSSISLLISQISSQVPGESSGLGKVYISVNSYG